MNLSRLNLETPQGALSLVGDIRLNPPYTLDLRTVWHWRLDHRTRILGQGLLQGPLQRLNISQQLTAPFPATLDAEVDVLRQTGKLKLSWRNARWPLAGVTVDAQSAAGQLHAEGSLSGYRLHIETALQTSQLDIPRLETEIDGNSKGLKVDHLTASLLDGTFKAHGAVTWKPTLNWQFIINAQNLDPGVLRTDWPGKLAVDGHLTGDNRRMQFALTRLEGRLRGLPISTQMQGAIVFADRQLTLTRAHLAALGARIDLNGWATPHKGNLQFTLDAPKLQAFSTQAGGSLHASGHISGPWQWPRVNARLDGKNLRLRALSIAHLSASIEPGRSDTLKTRLDIRDLHRAGIDLKQVIFSADGQPARMQLTLSAVASAGRLDARLSGGIKPGSARWDGRLLQFDLQPRKGSGWRLRAPAALRLTRHEIDISPTCLEPDGNPSAHLCLNLKFAPSGINLHSDWQQLPLAMLDPWLPAAVRISGNLSGHADLKGPLNALKGQLSASAPDGHLELTRSTGTRRYALVLSRLALDLHAQQLALMLNAGLPDGGKLDVRLDTGLSPQAPLNGRIGLNLPKLTFLDGLIPDTQAIEGTLQGNIQLAGTRASPLIDTQVTLNKGALILARAGIRLQDIQATLLGKGTQPLQVAVQARSGPGQIEARGEISEWYTPHPEIRLNVKGHQFEAVHLPQISAQISPTLTIEANPKRIQVRGRIDVPKADIVIKRVAPGAVDVSPDTQIVGVTASTKSHGPTFDAAIELALGQAIKLDAFGLAGQLTGDLLLTQRSGTPTVADGSLRIVNGTYSAYGLNLALSKGVLNFAGPVDNPGLDVVAQRQTGNVTAQLTVTGTLKSPRSQVSATPPMSESEALSWLITGHGLAGASKSDAALLLKALASMHMGNSEAGGGVLGSIKARTGLSDIGVQGGDSWQQSSLLLGKYLTPDLYVRYAAGLFDHSNTLALNYRLSQHFSVEAKSGSAQGIDLLYQIVFGPR
ncbi:hypothetical protein BI364_11745 [Acidihalobacter yilgarnensis]|uniref:Translocation and assembly module TamB C-terminal domain-containing protein n=1 Tax=Acidihalobacter yilgarnensis TaxID=2819280 RepID=A0A1D8IPW2_9GAMM|nr:translocation/assembly module TamB domain-containing protein [Acidihalobacter yilgarnensis]AOU98538.1 hypothetical protein BI364_11745 [Acidihalobacter yilgarnensis]